MSRPDARIETLGSKLKMQPFGVPPPQLGLMRVADHLPKGSIATKLMMLAIAALIAIIGLGISSIHFLRETGKAADRVYQEGVVQLMAVSRIELMLEKHRRIVESAPAEVDRGVIQKERQSLAQLGTQLDHEIAFIAGPSASSADQKVDVIASLSRLKQIGEQTLIYAEHFALDKAHGAARDYEVVATQLNDVVGQQRSQRARIANAETEALAATSKRTIIWICISAGLIVLLLVPVGGLVLRDVFHRLATIRTTVREVSQDRIDAKIPYTEIQDEVGELARALAHFQSNAVALHETKQRLARKNDELALFSEQLEARVAERTREALDAAANAESANSELARKVEEKTRVEEELRAANEKLLAATNAKTQFLANMSHEIRTPMNGVLGMCELILASKLDKRQHHLAKTIRQSAAMLLVIINDILDLSRIEAGKLEMDVKPLNLDDCMEDVAVALGPTAYGKGLEFGVEIEPDVPPVVLSDVVRLRQILLNLVGNAIKFTSSGVVAINVSVDRPEGGDASVKFEVRDTGIGILQEHQQQLFQSFSQADATITRRFGGTGLGLAIVKQLIHMLGGSISLRSQPGKGTTVVFTLPLAPSSLMAQVAVPMEIQRPQAKPKLVGLVSPARIRRKAVSSQIRRAGADVVEFETKLQLIERTEEGWRPDAIIVDSWPAGEGVDDHLDRQLSAIAGGQVIWIHPVGSQPQDRQTADGRQALSVSYPTLREDLRVALSAPDPPECALSVSPDVIGPKRNRELMSGLAVLVAEDNPVNQEIAQEFLSDLGCEVTLVENGQQVLDALDVRRFDIILMDCQMPVLGGMEATRWIRATEMRASLPAVPIIAVTASAFESDRQECLDCGMNGFLSKPFSQAELELAIVENYGAQKLPYQALSSAAPHLVEQVHGSEKDRRELIEPA